MKEIASIALESIVREKGPHVVNVIATGTAATAGAATSVFGELLGWMPHVAVFFGLLVSCAIFYKTMRDIRLAELDIEYKQLLIAKEGRRGADQK